jgi:hypothetical protein
MNRRTIRHVAAGLAAAMATIYYLIGAGVLTVVTGQADDPSMLGFGAAAGSAFLLGAILLVAFDRRMLWIVGGVFQVLVMIMYFVVAPERSPAFEVWGIVLRILQVPLFASLVYLALHPAERHPHPVTRNRR